MSTTDWLIPAITGAAAVCAAVSAQVVAAVFTARRELRALQSARDASTLQRDHDRLIRIFDSKREYYAEFLATVNSRYQLVVSAWNFGSVDVDETKLLNETYIKWCASLSNQIMNISLLAPTLESSLRAIERALLDLEVELDSPPPVREGRWRDSVRQVEADLEECRQDMRRDLNLA